MCLDECRPVGRGGVEGVEEGFLDPGKRIEVSGEGG